MELTFVTSDPNNSSRLKRSQACEACRRKKKRCRHAPHTLGISAIDGTGTPVSGREQELSSPIPTSPQTQTIQTTADVQVQSEPNSVVDIGVGHHGSPPDLPVKSSVWRFVGDLNPEALFQRQAESADSPSQSGKDKVGVWQSQNERTELSTTSGTPRSRLTNSFGDIRTPASRTHLDETSILPPEQDQARLISLYFERINSVIPLIDETCFRGTVASGSASTMLIQAMCLVAAKDYHASPYLRLTGNPDLLNVQEFCQALASALDLAFQSRIEKDKLVLIRALALSSLHVDGPDGAEEASMQLMQAVHHAQTIGLHLDTARIEMQDESLGNLFWSLWSLDRMNACINGRPIMMSNIDIGIKVRNSSRLHNSDAFRIWLRIADMIDKVIEFYRPSTDELLTGWENDFPGFEEIVRDCAALQLPSHILQTLELYYHAVAITSCRSQSFKSVPKSTPSTVRQAFSAICITRIIEDQNARNLLPLPVVPYSLSLALSVAYKHLRQTGLVTGRLQAFSELKACCKLLEILGDTWWSADAMAKLGRRALNEASKASGGSSNNLDRRNTPAIVNKGPDTGSIILSENRPNGPSNLDEGITGLTSEGLTMQANDGTLADIQATATGTFIQDDYSNSFGFNTSFDGIDQLLGDYLDLNLPTNFGDPLFIDDFYLPDQSMLDQS